MDPATEASVAQIKLAWWQEEMQRLIDGHPVHPISRFLAALPRAARTDFVPLQHAVEAATSHVAGAPLERGEALEAHSRALCGAPLIVAAQLAADRANETAAQLGRSVAALAAAEYLAGAIAGYRREARFGRIVFPVDELLAAGIGNADLAASAPPAGLQSYLEELRRRAARFFAMAIDELPRPERAPLRHLSVLAALGAKHLNSRKSPSDAGFRLHDLYLAWTTARRAALPT
jgi:15-cis-phytoene synthase